MFAEKNKVKIFDFTPKNKDVFKSTREVYDEMRTWTDNDSCPDYVDVIVDPDTNESIFCLPVHGYFFFDTVHGESGALMLNEYNMYIPKHMLSVFREFTTEEIEAVRQNHLGISLYLYDSKQRKECVGISLHDI